MPNAWNTNLINRLKGGAGHPVVLLELRTGQNANVYYAVSGDRRLFGHPNVITRLTPQRGTWDWRSQRFSVGKLTVGFGQNWWMRLIASSLVLGGAQVTFKVGYPDLAEGDFETFFRGLARDGNSARAGISLEVEGPESLIRDQQIQTLAWGAHPADQFLAILQAVGVDPSFYSAAEMDPTHAIWDGTEHWGCALAGNSTFFERNLATPVVELPPASAIERWNQLCQITNCAPIQGPDGKLRLRRIDRSAASVRTLTADDILEVQTKGIWGGMINRVSVELGTSIDFSAGMHAEGFLDRIRVTADATTLQADIGVFGGAGRILSEEIGSPWLQQADFQLIFNKAASLASSTIHVLNAPARFGWAGMCLPPSSRVFGGGVPAAQLLDAAAGRYAYIGLTDAKGHYEFFRCPSVLQFWSDVFGNASSYIDPFDQRYEWPPRAEYTFDQRHLFGSNAQWGVTDIIPFGGLYAFDATIPVAWAQERLAWLGSGVPQIRVRCTLAQTDLDYLDIVDIQDDLVLATGLDYPTLSTIGSWAIVGIEQDWLGDKPGVWLDLVWVRTSAVPPPPTTTITARTPVSQPRQHLTDQLDGAVPAVRSVSDFGVDSIAGLVVNLTDGWVYRGPNIGSYLTATKLLPLKASSDVYVYADARSGGFVISPLAPGSARPSPPLRSLVPLYMFATDATSVTSTTDLREPVGEWFRTEEADGLDAGVRRRSRRYVHTGGTPESAIQIPIRWSPGAKGSIRAEVVSRDGTDQHSWTLRASFVVDGSGNVTVSTVAGSQVVWDEAVSGDGWTAEIVQDSGSSKVLAVEVTASAGARTSVDAHWMFVD